MNHKLAVRIAVIMVLVFGVMIVAYPRLFSPEKKSPAELPPSPPVMPVGPQ